MILKGKLSLLFFFFFQAEDGIRDRTVTGVQTCALPIFYLVILGIYKVAGVAVGKVQERIGAKRTRVVKGKQMRETSSKVVSGVQLIAKGRSEERRVGKECRCGWGREYGEKREECRVVCE